MQSYDDLSREQYKEYESKVEVIILKFSGLITRKAALWMLYKNKLIKPNCQCNNPLYCKKHGVIK